MVLYSLGSFWWSMVLETKVCIFSVLIATGDIIAWKSSQGTDLRNTYNIYITLYNIYLPVYVLNVWYVLHVIFVDIHMQLSFEQHGFELHGFTWTFSINIYYSIIRSEVGWLQGCGTTDMKAHSKVIVSFWTAWRGCVCASNPLHCSEVNCIYFYICLCV